MIKAPKGTKDILPSNAYKWQYIEKNAREICENFGYKEVRTPTFEATELFLRGVGDTTDVVEKQMYTFMDKGDRSITLRPEVTASVVRAYIENSLYADGKPVKLFYIQPCFRYEKPQAGRLRQFHQFGVEVFGADSPSIDAEVISLVMAFLENVGMSDLVVKINSIGCPECRKVYNDKLHDFLKDCYEDLCDTCKGRFDRNPLRILDCKSEVCHSLTKNAPVLLDSICDSCKEHFEKLQVYLNAMNIPFEIDSGIVRGLDYYTKTVFEVQSDKVGSQSAICGGGRYDGLVEELGGDKTTGIGFAMGLDRLILSLENDNADFGCERELDVFVVTMGEEAEKKAQSIVYNLRKVGIKIEKDHLERSLKAQMKHANKLKAKFSFVLGENELSMGMVNVKNMQTGEVFQVDIDELEKSIKEVC